MVILSCRMQLTHLTVLMGLLQLSCRGVAAGVQLDTDGVAGIFSDNGFLLVPWEKRTITFKGRSDFKVKELVSSVSILSMADTLSGGGLKIS